MGMRGILKLGISVNGIMTTVIFLLVDTKPRINTVKDHKVRNEVLRIKS